MEKILDCDIITRCCDRAGRFSKALCKIHQFSSKDQLLHSSVVLCTNHFFIDRANAEANNRRRKERR